MNVMKNFIASTIYIFVLASNLVKGQNSGCDPVLSWICANGECIGIGERCNGIADCSDSSDEIALECISFQCADNMFRCAYGACVNQTAECNGIKDCADNSDELTAKCLPDIDETVRGKCSFNQFQCLSGECIPYESLCDGTTDCQDKSDETVDFCVSSCCPKFGFRCGYGGCVDKKVVCDGNIDCFDESDENYLLCGYPKGMLHKHKVTPTSATSQYVNPFPSPLGRHPDACLITRIPLNGWIEYRSEPKEKLSFGDYVEPFSLVSYNCSRNHLIDGPPTNFCFRGQWKDAVPDCKPKCSTKAISGVSILAKECTLNDAPVSCSQPSEPGTIAHIHCRDRYFGSKQQIIACDEDGTWTPSPEPCSPICGEEAPIGTPFVIGGFNATISQVPWHIGIYQFVEALSTYNLVCGGTIANARVVISAMHCFWDRSQGKPFDASLFHVAAGKELSDYNAIEQTNVQKFGVEFIFHDPGYNDVTGNYAADIAVIVLNKPIIFEAYIAPICIPFGLQYEEKTVQSGWLGRVAGWGLTSSGGKASPVLKYVDLRTVDHAKCLADSDIEFRPNITPDKFCAGYLNQNISVCQGDSGGGLVFPKTEDGRKKFYLRGIVSTGVLSMESSCDSNKYTTFTNIAYFDQMIATYTSRYRPR